MPRGNPNARGVDRRMSAIERSIRQQLDTHPGKSIPLIVLACQHIGVPAYWRIFDGGKLRTGAVHAAVDREERGVSRRRSIRRVVNRLVATGEFWLRTHDALAYLSR
jgi:hypothetical protein